MRNAYFPYYHGSLHGMLQFADVSRPIVVEQLLSGLFVDFYWSFVVEIGEFLDELLCERYYLLLTFTQWWKVEAYGVHAIEQVLAECTFPHHILQVAVGG